MKKFYFTFFTFFAVCAGLSAWADAPDGFYDNAIGKHDEGLMTALEGIVYTHTLLSYNYMWTAYDSTDVGSTWTRSSSV